MNLENIPKQSLQLMNSPTVINDVSFKQLLENCFSVLKGGPEPYNMKTLLGSKPIAIKDFYSSLLSMTAQAVRHKKTEDEVAQYLLKECQINPNRVKIYREMYGDNREGIEISLLNIGSYLPHVTDVGWKVDYIVKSSESDESDGPLLRISLVTEVYDETAGKKKWDYVNFTCNSRELHDLLYKLKDAVRHCQHVSLER